LALTRSPRIFAGEASEMQRGAVIDAIPTPSPTKTLPMMRRAGPGAEAMITAPVKNRKSAMRIALLLPYRSFAHPPIAAPMIAPATAILTMLSYLWVIIYSQDAPYIIGPKCVADVFSIRIFFKKSY